MTRSAPRNDARTPPAAAGSPEAERALLDVIDEISRLHFRLGALAARLHREGVTSAGRRAILRNLVELGPKTVPELAAMRPVSRQYIQMLVNELRADGLVELAANPAHRRSKLVRITAAGRAAFEAMLARERPAVAWLADGFSRAELEAAYALLVRLRGRADALDPDDAGGGGAA